MTPATSVHPGITITATKQPANTKESSILWGAHDSREETAEPTPRTTDIHTYVYAPGDSCNVINAQDGIHLLWLRHIRVGEVSLQPTCHGKIQVSYKQEPILRMVGVNVICTDDGCFNLAHWLNRA